MFVIPGLAALFAFIYVRPHEIIEALHPITLGQVLAVVTLGYVIDVRIGVARLRGSPLLGLAVAFFAFSFLSVGIKAPGALDRTVPVLSAAFIAFAATSEGLQSLRAFGVVATIVFVLSLFLSIVCVHQGLSAPTCVDRREDAAEAGQGTPVSDGRPCETISDCNEGGVPGVEYLCEHAGLFNTRSIGLRVRYRGVLQDPNELAWAVGIAIPIAISLYERKRSLTRLLLMLGVGAVTVVCVIMTQSRSGQLSIPAVVGVYFIRKFGIKGVIVGAIASVPVLLLGGRGGEGAESSSIERLECWSTALSLWREYPFMGVGTGQFIEHHYLTAHNSVLLCLAELGPAGLVLWSMVIYTAFKIVLRVQIDFKDRPETAVARSWAIVLTGMLTGFVVSAFFLSLAYHTIFWIEIGLVGSLYGSVRRHEPEWKVKIGWRDLFIVMGVDLALVIVTAIYVRMKVG